MVSRRGVLALGVLAGLAGCASDPDGPQPSSGGCLPGLPDPAPVFPGGGGPLPRRMALSRDGARIASATGIGGSEGLLVWDAATGEITTHRPEFTGGAPVWLDGSRVAWAVGSTAAILDVDSGEAVHLPLGHRLIDAEDSAPLGSLGLAASVDGTLLASVGADRTLRRFALDSCAVGRVVDLDFGPTQIGWTARHLLVGGSSRARIYDAQSGDEVVDLDQGARAPVLGPRDGAVVFAGLPSTFSFGSFDPVTGKLLVAYPDGHGVSAAVTPDAKLLATFGSDAGVRLHDVEEGGVPRSVELPARTGDVVFLDDDRFLTIHLDEGLLEWDATTGRIARSFDRP